MAGTREYVHKEVCVQFVVARLDTPPMATSRKAMASGLLLWLLLVHSGMAPSVLGSDNCWVGSSNYPICFHQPKCRGHCQDHGNVDGRCEYSFPDLVPASKLPSLSDKPSIDVANASVQGARAVVKAMRTADARVERANTHPLIRIYMLTYSCSFRYQSNLVVSRP
ncbi:hypothetical protein BS78_09G173800 [Paspalum vaginatum]|nr:hypothetical protein BS78_09G173800 [Paspalum vaginatum]